jgi:VanZ family protein
VSTFWRIAPAVAWAALIFALSAQPDLPRAPSSLLDLLLKKGAHLTEYAVLAVLVHHALGPALLPGERSRVGLAWGITLLYAVTDEIHQAFVPGRTAAATDVAIDGLGALLGLCLRWTLEQWWSRGSTIPGRLGVAPPSPPAGATATGRRRER